MKTKSILAITKFIFWIIFIGLPIKNGALLFNFGMSINNPDNAENLYLGLDLYSLRQQNLSQFVAVDSLLIAVVALQAYLAYLVIKISTEGSI